MAFTRGEGFGGPRGRVAQRLGTWENGRNGESGVFSLFPILLVSQRDFGWPSLNRSRLDPSAGVCPGNLGFT